jgi:hypothetical protein
MAGHGADATADRFAAAADELYGLPLSEFTAARADRAKQARADGDRAAAAAIEKLRKPNVVAWLANQLARGHHAELAPLLELGEALRQATSALDAGELRQLSRQQRRAVSGLVVLARELAAAAGQGVSDSTARGLEDTLHAALADEAAARQLTQGQLAVGLSRTGFPGIDSASDTATAWAAAPAGPRAAVAPPGPQSRAAKSGPPDSAAGRSRPGKEAERPGRRPGKAEADRRERAAQAAAEAHRQQLERARRAEADAQNYAGEAGRDQDRARSALSAAQSTAREAEETISRLQDKLDAALNARNSAGPALRQAGKESDRADRTARQAKRRLAEATARRRELERGASAPVPSEAGQTETTFG